MIKKLKELILSPHSFFTNAAQEDDINKAYLFALIFGSIGLIFEFTYALLWPTKFFLDNFGAQYKTILIALIIFSPLIITLNVLLYTLLYHLFLLAAGARKGIKKTFQVICYSSSIYILNIVPFIGIIVAGLWNIALCIIGAKKTQQINYAQAIGAMLALIIFFVIISMTINKV